MTRYRALCCGTEIGLLEINELGQHRYTPNSHGVSIVRSEIMPFYELIAGQDWGTPIPLWKNRIDDAARFGDVDYISQHTDDFELIRITDDEVENCDLHGIDEQGNGTGL